MVSRSSSHPYARSCSSVGIFIAALVCVFFDTAEFAKTYEDFRKMRGISIVNTVRSEGEKMYPKNRMA